MLRGSSRTNCQPKRCGDTILDTGEVCDDGDADATDACTPDCLSDGTCGNGYVDVAKGESCDDGGTAAGDGCNALCRMEVCGNGVLDAGEACDNFNTISGDGCSADCQSDETCGNGIVDTARGEQCDAGAANSNLPNAGCRTTCQSQRCGDGIADLLLGEGCDQGTLNSTAPDAACRPNCQPGRCGDTILDTGEVCDDGDADATDDCTPDCLSDGTCGNGYVDVAKGEGCDDSNVVAGDGCNALCRTEVCGNGVLDAGEACDHGNTVSGDGCSEPRDLAARARTPRHGVRRGARQGHAVRWTQRSHSLQ